MPISHVLIKAAAADQTKLINFYVSALKSIGYQKLVSFPNGLVGFGVTRPDWFVGVNESGPNTTVHVAFSAPGMLSCDISETWHSFSVQPTDKNRIQIVRRWMPSTALRWKQAAQTTEDPV